jgi:WD40 repeat protein
MPNFPIYHGELPEVLSPLKVRHYWMLACWVYFRPTALHCYLHQAAPDITQLRGLRKLLKTWSVPAYRNIYLMLPIAIALLGLLVGLALFLFATSSIQHNTAWVNAIAVTPDGQIAVSATGDRALEVKLPSADSALQVWNLRWGLQTHALRGHQAGVTAVAVTPDGKWAVSGSRDRTLKVWDIRRGKQLHTLKGHQEWVTNVAVTPDGQRAISVSADKTLKVWDIKQGKELYTLTGHTDLIWAVVVTPDGKQAISASADKTLKVWDIEQGKELHALTGHRAWVTSVALTPDGEQAVSASVDKTLKVWDIEQGTEKYTLTGHRGWVTGVALSPDGKQAVSASADQTLKVWDIEQGKALNTLTGHSGWVTSVAMTPDGKQAVSASADQTLKVWDLQNFKALHTLFGHHAWVTAIAILPNASRLLSASFEGYPKLWSLNRGTEQPMLGAIGMDIGLNLGLVALCTLAAITLAVIAALILAIGVMTFGVPGSILSGVAVVLALSLIFFIAFLGVDRIAADPTLKELYKAANLSTIVTVIFGIALGIIVGVTFGLASRTALGFFASIVFIAIVGVAVGIVVACVVTPSISLKGRVLPGIRAGMAVTVVFNMLVALGALRIPFYPLELIVALHSQFRGKWHSVTWDELLVLPVPGIRALLQARLRASELEGLLLAADVARNPFQRAWSQRALHAHLHSIAAPLHFLYYLLTCEDFNTYLVTPVSKLDRQLLPTTRQVLLGELAHQRVDCSSDGMNQMAETLVWSATWLVRDRKPSPLTRFAGMLYQLSYSKTVEVEGFNLSSYEKTYAGLTRYPGGTEIAQSFEALAIFLAYDNLSELSTAGDVVSRLASDETSIRSSVLTALTRCGEIGAKVLIYQTAVTTVEQLATLAQIASALDVLDEYVVARVVTPEQAIIRRIIRQWHRLVSQAIAELGKTEQY